MIEPYPFIRVVTFTLATFWSVRSVLRTLRLLDEVQRRLAPFGIQRRWLAGVALRMALHATVLDPINLLLSLVLLSVWVA